jgi:hypothetical protein
LQEPLTTHLEKLNCKRSVDGQVLQEYRKFIQLDIRRLFWGKLLVHLSSYPAKKRKPS